jgi:adenylate kinase family enzyme
MKKIIGVSGAGKSVLSREMTQRVAAVYLSFAAISSG